MITLNYHIDINDLSLLKDSTNDKLLLTLTPIYMKNSNVHKLSSTTKINIIEIANNDLLSINLSIKNTSKYIRSLKFKFIDDDIFQFIPCSLINTNTQEVYVSDSTDSNLFSLSSLSENETLKIKFFIRTDFTELDSNKLNTIVRFFDHNKYSSSDDTQIYLAFKQSAIQLTSIPHKNLLKIENVGTSPLKDVVLHYSIPLGYKVNLNSLSASFNNNPYKVVAKQIGSEVLLKLDSLPAKENNQTKAVQVFLKHTRYSYNLSGASLSISISKEKQK